MFVFINSDQSPSVVISSEELSGAPLRDSVPQPPHLLELHPYLVERLGYHGYENVLDQPRQEEDHRTAKTYLHILHLKIKTSRDETSTMWCLGRHRGLCKGLETSEYLILKCLMFVLASENTSLQFFV